MWSLTAWLTALAILCALIWFGRAYHWVEAAGGPERDGFVTDADEVRAGALASTDCITQSEPRGRAA